LNEQLNEENHIGNVFVKLLHGEKGTSIKDVDASGVYASRYE
jgi:hypothetical protein